MASLGIQTSAEAQGQNWWETNVPPADLLDRFPGMKALTDRQHELCRIYGIQIPDSRNCGVELRQNLRGGSIRQIRQNACDIVTPHGQLLLCKRARLACGVEMLLLQGIHFADAQFKLEEYEDQNELLQNLAGNAFNTFACSAAYVTKKMVEAHLYVRALVRTRQASKFAHHSPTMTQRKSTMDDIFAFEE